MQLVQISFPVRRQIKLLSYAAQQPSSHASNSDVEEPTPGARKDRIGPTFDVLSQALKAATAATALFPPAQSVIGGLGSVVERFRISF